MDNEIQLISDGEGVTLFGPPNAVESFLQAEGLASKPFSIERLGPIVSQVSGLAQVGSEISANSGRWLKLTEESARAMDKLPMVVNSKTSNLHATLRAPNGQFAKNLQFVNGKTAGGTVSFLSNPAFLAGAAGIMTQLAMQQTMDEITEYLAVIDKKLDDVLLAQKNAVLAELMGVEFVIAEAMSIRKNVGRVSDVTWSKLNGSSETIGRVQGRALLELKHLTGKLEHQTKLSELAKTAQEAKAKVLEWLAVLAHCLQLQEGLAVLELDRVLDAAPDELDQHRAGLQIARQERREVIGRSTELLLVRIIAAGGTANTKVLLQPTASRAVVSSGNYVAQSVFEFHERLGIETTQETLDARRWLDAAIEVRDSAIETGSESVDAAVRLGQKSFSQAKSVTDRLSSGLSQRTFRRSRGGPELLEDHDQGADDATG